MSTLHGLLSNIALILKGKNNIEEGLSPQSFKNELLNITSDVITETIVMEESGKNVVSKVVIEDGVKYISDNAYNECTINQVDFPSSLEAIGQQSFYHSNIESISIPDNVKTIGDSAFRNCHKLSQITLNSTALLEQLGRYAFGQSSLENLYIPPKVNNIISGLVVNTPSLSTISVDENNETYDSREGCNAIIQTVDNTLIAGCKGTTVPKSVTKIGNSAFLGHTYLVSIDIEHVTSIGMEAFSKTRVSEITLNDAIHAIEVGVFRNCSSLTTINIPNSCTIIYGAAFAGCNKLKSLKFPELLIRISDQAFLECSSMELLDFRDLKSIPLLTNSNAFDDTPSTMKIVVPDVLYEEWIRASNWIEFGPYGENVNRKNKIIKAGEYTESN